MTPIFAKQPDDNAPPAPPIAAPVFANPQMPDDAQAYPNEGGPGDLVVKAIHSLFTLPQRAIENSQNSLDTGTYDPAPTLEAATLPMGTGAIAGVPVRAGEAVLGAGPIRAYHGSPYSFDKFDLSKIGTGEGAQAYGHGLYFAENEGVAKSYRDTLGGDTLITPKGTVFDPMTLEHMNIRSRAHSNGSNLDATIETAQKIADSNSPVADMAKRDLEKLQALKAEGGVKRNPGSMYEVNINADPEHFLDWDKPLSEQPQAVQDHFAKQLEQFGPDAKMQPQIMIAGSRHPGGMQGVTKDLAERGIPGIKYLDQGSRAAGDGSRNYVVFDHNLIDIARKYGLAGAAIPPAIAPLFARGNQGQGS